MPSTTTGGASNAWDGDGAVENEPAEAAAEPVVTPVEEDPAPGADDTVGVVPVQVGETIPAPADGTLSETGTASNPAVEDEPVAEQIAKDAPAVTGRRWTAPANDAVPSPADTRTFTAVAAPGAEPAAGATP